MGRSLRVLAAVMVGLLGCGVSDDDPPHDPDPRLEPPPASADDAPRGYAKLARTWRALYQNAATDVLGVGLIPAGLLPEDGRDGAGNATSAAASVPDVRAWLASAEWVANEPGGRAAARTLAGCAADAKGPLRADERRCVAAGAAPYARRLFRRPSSVDRFVSLYAARRGEGADALAAARTVLVALLTAPELVYVGDLDATDGVRPLDGYAVAARLAAFLWQSVPDDALLDAAARGALASKSDVTREARRMLGGTAGFDPRAVRGLRAFARHWLALERAEARVKSTALFPEFDDRVRGSLSAESELFVADVVLSGDARYETLLTAPFAWVNAATAPLYRAPVDALDGTTFRRVPLDPAERAGILTQVGVLAMTGHAQAPSPTLRGRLVRERFLCEKMVAPPNGINIMPPVADPTATVREQYRQFMSNPSCATCHVKMDPIGSGLLGFDTAGRRQKFENNAPIDEHGAIVGGGDAEGEFVGARGLAEKLARSGTAQKCFAKQVVRFALRRDAEDDEERAVDELTDAFARGNHDIRELFVSVAASDFFRFRRGRSTGEEN